MQYSFQQRVDDLHLQYVAMRERAVAGGDVALQSRLASQYDEAMEHLADTADPAPRHGFVRRAARRTGGDQLRRISRHCRAA